MELFSFFDVLLPFKVPISMFVFLPGPRLLTLFALNVLLASHVPVFSGTVR